MMPLTQAFQVRTATVLRSMRSRFKEKANKRGKIIRPGREVPVTLADFRFWVLYHLGGKEEGCGRCEYCGQPVDAMNFSTDHKVPVKRGGSLGTENFGFCCEVCNRIKGMLTEGEFRQLLALLKTWDAAAAKDVKNRLKMGEGFRRVRFFPQPPKVETAPSAGEQLALEEPW